MIKKQFRLKTKDIKEMFRKKTYKKLTNELFMILYQYNNLSYPRFAIICKKKLLKKAILRNRIKRRIYEIIRTDILPIKFKKNYDFLILPQKEESFINFKESLLKIFKRFNV